MSITIRILPYRAHENALLWSETTTNGAGFINGTLP